MLRREGASGPSNKGLPSPLPSLPCLIIRSSYLFHTFVMPLCRCNAALSTASQCRARHCERRRAALSFSAHLALVGGTPWAGAICCLIDHLVLQQHFAAGKGEQRQQDERGRKKSAGRGAEGLEKGDDRGTGDQPPREAGSGPSSV